MKIEQKLFRNDTWNVMRSSGIQAGDYHLVLVFGNSSLIGKEAIYKEVRQQYHNAELLICSTAGEIADVEVNDDSLSLTAISFEKTSIASRVINIADVKNSFEAGYRLASSFNTERLKNVLVISDGQKVNGSELVMGLQDFLPENVIITGGLAGDGTNFKQTLVGLNNMPAEGNIAAIGFYGDELKVTYGSVGGWDTFGPERLITKSEANILYELDGQPALDIYKMYLGEYADKLPGSGLLFPLSLRFNGKGHLVRTILGVNEEEKSLTFAGNVPKGLYAQLMKANFDRLIEGASDAAKNSIINSEKKPEIAILISCVGRKLVLDQRIEEEIEVVRATYGENTAITGFYSYGEISPSFNFMKCELHNQTMTITTLTEL